jgi:glycosyltransferase involved in cell wall biosynthesis
MMKFPFISIIVPAFNEELYIRRCLESLVCADYPREKREIILVDNGSTDSTKLIAKEYDVAIIDKPLVKVGAVRNYGVISSQGEIIVFLDADCVVGESWLKNGVEAIFRSRNCVFGGQYRIRKDPSWLERYWILSDEESNIYQTTLVGGAIFVQKEHFNRVGGFNERLSAGEDSDLTERLRAEGYNVEIDPSLSVIHLGYPNTIKSFLGRQIWHSSDYVGQLPSSLKDKVFILTLLFILGSLFLISCLFWPNWISGSLSLLAIFSPIVLSIKRISRSGQRSYSLKDILAIYVVDLLYLVGRSGGVFRGVFEKAISPFVGASDLR